MRIYNPKFSTDEEALEYGYKRNPSVDEFEAYRRISKPGYDLNYYIGKIRQINTEDPRGDRKANRLLDTASLHLDEDDFKELLKEYDKWLSKFGDDQDALK